jgi:hypothetical protein
LESGNRERAADYALRAAHHAESALAFEQAASCYRQALALRPLAGSERVALYTKLGEALAHASRGAESAEAFLVAMAAASGATAQRLKQRASEQLLRSGHIDRGVRLLRELLSSLGLRYAKTPREALLQILWYRARLRLRGLRFTPRALSEVPEEELLRLDACRSAAESLSLIDITRGSVFRSQFVLLALQSGERERIVFGTLLEASMLSSAGGAGAAAAMPVLDLSRRLAAELGSAKAAAMVTINEAGIEHNLGHWRPARELFDAVESDLRARCTGVAWEVSTARFYSIRCSLHMGEFARVTRRLDADLEEAAQRGDLYMEICLRTVPVPHLLTLHAEPQAARQALQAAARLMGDGEYPLQRYYHVLSSIDVDLYEGRAADAFRRVEAEIKRLRQIYLLRVQIVRIMAVEQRARCLLLLAAGVAGRARKSWLEQATAEATRLRREAAPWAMPLAMRHEAAILALRGDVEQAAAKLDAATEAFSTVDMHMHAAALRLVHGQLVGGTEGELLVRRGTAELTAEGVVSPARWAAALHPGTVEARLK